MKALFIGGTGNISTAISKRLVSEGWDLTLLNRGHKNDSVPGAKQIIANINETDEETILKALGDETYDVVADFICFVPTQAERDIRLFGRKTKQFIFISSASAYQKPLSSARITESTPLSNPYYKYSRDKIACEETFMKAYRETGFPITIVRPSHTFSDWALPLCVDHRGAWPILKRMMEGKKIIMAGDGTSLWAVMKSDDFAPAFIGLMGNLHAIGEAVQITGEELLTWNQIMQAIANALGVEYKPCYVPSTLLAAYKKMNYSGALIGDKANTVIFDNAKLHRLVPGLPAPRRFDQACRESIQYFLSHPELQRESPEFDAFSDRLVEIMENAEKEIANM